MLKHKKSFFMEINKLNKVILMIFTFIFFLHKTIAAHYMVVLFVFVCCKLNYISCPNSVITGICLFKKIPNMY